jgi:hypothetical protein
MNFYISILKHKFKIAGTVKAEEIADRNKDYKYISKIA